MVVIAARAVKPSCSWGDGASSVRNARVETAASAVPPSEARRPFPKSGKPGTPLDLCTEAAAFPPCAILTRTSCYEQGPPVPDDAPTANTQSPLDLDATLASAGP